MTNEREKQARTVVPAGQAQETRYLLDEPYPVEEPAKPAPASASADEPFDPWAEEELHEARISGLPLPPKLRRRLR